MKRAISMLGAIAALAVGFSVAAPAAHAQTPPTCIAYPTTPLADTPASAINSWPRTKEKSSSPAHSSVFNCTGSTSSEFSGMWQAANNIAGTGTNQPPAFLADQFYQSKVRIYFYTNLGDLNAHWNTAYTPPGGVGEIYGITLRSGDSGAPGVPVGSVGIMWKSPGGTTYNLNAIKGAVHHELGHVFDNLQGNPSVSGTSAWKTARVNDIFTLNATGGGSTPAARSALFNGIDVQNDYATCWDEYQDYDIDDPMDPGYPHTGKTHWEVAQCMWPYFTENEELFANVFGKRIGNLLAHQGTQPKLYDFSFFLGGFWDEMRDYMDTIDWTGYTP